MLGRALEVAPGLAGATVSEIRVGLRPASADGLPILGPVPGCANAWVATGMGPTGLTIGPFGGALIADLAMGLAPDPAARIDLLAFAPDRPSAPPQVAS